MLNAAQSLPPPRRYEVPAFAVPRGACDTHTHVIPMGGWTLVPGATYMPAAAPADAQLAMLDVLTLDRGVIVQPSVFGTDNTAVIDAIARAPTRLRGVAVVEASVTDDALQALHTQGIRGLRFNIMLGGSSLAAMKALAPRMAELGWHAEVLADGLRLPQLASALMALPCRLVIDHMASLRNDVGIDAEPMKVLRKLVAERETWVKLSGTYRLAGNPSDPCLAERGRVLTRDAPERMVWGSDWPHVACRPMPDAGRLLNVLAEWFDADPATLQKILVDNPAELFDFPAIPAV
jgi:predicted TIM-barrel fold metal-dependent hydrolase